MILYTPYTHCMHLIKDSSDYFVYMGGRADEDRNISRKLQRGKTEQRMKQVSPRFIISMSGKNSEFKGN